MDQSATLVAPFEIAERKLFYFYKRLPETQREEDACAGADITDVVKSFIQ
jgi:hypothetical protein